MISPTAGSESVNYEGVALVELEIEGVEYRLDAGKQALRSAFRRGPRAATTGNF